MYKYLISYSLPIFIQVGLTFFLGFWMAKERASAIRSGAVGPEAALYPVRWPEQTQKITNSFHNQLELPMLYYVVMIFSLLTLQINWFVILLSWAFVASRLAHAYIHTTSNDLKLRGTIFIVGVVLLMLLWISLAFKILIL